jgi:hypothetical protein
MNLNLFASLALMSGVLACSTPAPQPTSGDQAQSVLAASKAVTGGSAWDAMDGVYEEGQHGQTTYQTRLDFHAYGMRVDTSREGMPAVIGYNGAVAWRSLGGHTMTQTDAAALADRRQSAYISMNGYYFPERFPAHFTYMGKQQDRGRDYDIVRAEPEGARGIDLWFDSQTHLLSRMVDYAGAPPVTVTVSDYRDIGGVRFAFHGVISDAQGDVVDVLNVSLMRPMHINRGAFDPPTN